MTREQIQSAVENLIDKSSLRQVVEALSIVCSDKADHLQSNWQDEASAATWRHDAVVIGNIEHRIEN